MNCLLIFLGNPFIIIKHLSFHTFKGMPTSAEFHHSRSFPVKVSEYTFFLFVNYFCTVVLKFIHKFPPPLPKKTTSFSTSLSPFFFLRRPFYLAVPPSSRLQNLPSASTPSESRCQYLDPNLFHSRSF